MGALLERDAELARIETLLDRARDGEGGLLLIEGEAGAGKTSLLDTAGHRGAERGMLVLGARGGEYERDFPYGVARQLFEPPLSDPVRRAELLKGSAALAAPMFAPEAASVAGGDPHAIMHGLFWLVADMAAAQPLLLLVDDAQWADRASLRALAYIARRLDGIPATLALTVRIGDPGEPAALLDELRHQHRACLIEPPPLSARAAATLLADGIGHGSRDGLAEICVETTAGNPFLLTQLLRALDSEEACSAELDAERITELAAAGAAKSLLVRLSRLGEHAAEVAGAIAVLEPNAEAHAVSQLAGLPAAVVAEESARMIQARLLSESRPLSFVHPLVRAAVLAEVQHPLRSAAHARAARLLHESGAGADTVSAHLLLSEPDSSEWAVARLREAASEAIGRGAAETSVLYLRRALREPPPEDERLAVSRELGIALLRANDPEGIDVLRAVRGALEDPIARAEIVAEFCLSLNLRGRGDEAIALLEESLAELPDPDSAFAAGIRGYLLLVMFWGGDGAPDAALLGPDDEQDPSLPEVRLGLYIRAVLGALGLGPIGPAQELAEQLSADRAALEADALAGLGSQGILAALALCDRNDLAEGLFDPILDATIRRGALPGIGGHHGIRGFCRYLDGELREGQADAETGVQVPHELGMLTAVSVWLGAWLRCATARGDYETAEAMLADVWGEREAVRGVPGGLFLCARGEFRLATGRSAEAAHDYLAAAERVRWLPFANPEALDWRTGLASCEAALGNREEAERLAAEALEIAREAGGQRGIGVTLRVLGEVSGGPEGVVRLRESAEILGKTNARFQHARALAELGAALRRANRRREAREPLREALELAHRCGAAPLEEMARTELAATGARPRKAVFSGVESLTPSELRVARMAADGMTNREIAQALTVTAKTVETHMRHVFQKLDVSRRTGLAAALGEDTP